MLKDARLEVRIESSLKKKAESIFQRVGISPTEAIRIFYKQVELREGIPFSIHIPNKETLAAIKEIESGKAKKTFASFDEYCDEMGA
ncbi:hypothetical protein MNBD_UNCLBAC01-248 [hydrothermal vent metagenome]|uniref:DNA-damage-inducible protein J n=1 Tax=hydrothermal vent metagenome TaxID=652676 RepID=A0A3B1DGB8_9ZZZZ